MRGDQAGDRVLDCDLCGGLRSEALLEKNGASYRRCLDCGLVFSDLSPLASAVANEDFFAAQVARYAARSYAPEKQRLYSRRLGPFEPYRKLGRLLDIGANVGGFVHRAREEGWEAVGVEPVRACADWARREKGLDLRPTTLEEAGFAASSFDGVYSNAVFEHLRRPSLVFAELARVLRPGGLVVIDTVNWESYTRERLGRDWKLVDPRVHLCLYGPETLAAYCRKAGLEVLGIRTHGVRFLPNHLPRRRGLARLLEEIRKCPLSALAKIRGKGDRIGVRARKPVETASGSAA